MISFSPYKTLRRRSAVPSALVSSVHCGKRSYVFSGSNTNEMTRQSFKHPLAPEDPSKRSITVPDSIHKQYGGVMAQSPEQLKRQAERALLLQMQQDVLWEGTVISSLDNDLVKHLTRLSTNPKYRNSQNLVVVGGRELIRELCEKGYTPKHLLITEGKDVPEWTGKYPDMELVTVTRQVSESCSPGNDGYIGDFEVPTPPPKEHLIANKQRLGRVLVLDNVDDHGMLGTILRTAVGFQYDAIVVSNHCADIYDNRVIRAARGAHFQTGVPIYTLREEDGDNTYGMLNHVVERNELLPVCVVGQEDLPTAPSAATPIIAGAKKTPVIPSSAPRKSTLQDFCLERFTSSSSSGDNEKGYMLFAGPNHTKNMMKRITTKMKKPPVQLLVDSLPSGCDLMMTLPVAMHALRPHGDWDYLPLAEKHDPSTADLQTRRVNVDIGPDRHSVSEKDFNLDEEEQTQLANEKNAFRKWKRLRKNQMTDYDMWMTAEEKRVNEMLRNTRRQMIEPWNTEQTNKHEKGAAGMPDWVPNIIDEYRQNVDRDSLREEREMSESFRRPSNYNRP